MPHTRQEKPLSERLKAFFRVGKASGFPHPSSYELELSPEIVDEISSHQPTVSRLKALKELGGQVRVKRLPSHGVELLWWKVQDLLDPGQERDTRHAALEFLMLVVVGQYGSLDMMRPVLFNFIRDHKVEEDFDKKVSLLVAMTDNGKDIIHIEECVGPLLLELLKMEDSLQLDQLLKFSTNMVQYNSAYMGQTVVSALILSLARLSCTAKSDKDILLSLEVFKCIIMYSYVPPEALVPFISCVCKVVNLAGIATEAWDTMRKLMGTHLGHSALYQLCQIIHSPENLADTALIRGAVFFIGQSLWGPQRIKSLEYSPMAVLPVFCTALATSHHLVLYEVVIQVERLVTQHQEDIKAPSWEEALTVLELLVTKLGLLDSTNREALHQHLQATIGQLETLAETDSYAGSRTRLYSLVESVSSISPDSSVIQLIEYQQRTFLHPARHGWLDRLASMMERLYCKEDRQVIRLKVLEVLREVVTSNIILYEEELLEKGVLPFLSSVEKEQDLVVRVGAVRLIALFAVKSSGKHLQDLVDILEKIVKKFGESPPTTDTAIVYSQKDLEHTLEAVRGLIDCFKAKIYLGPANIAKKCYSILVMVLDNIYDRPYFMELTGETRLEIFNMLLSIRANRFYHLGFPRLEEGDRYSYSPLVVCETEDKVEGVVLISLTRACMCVLRCLTGESDWAVLESVLKKLPGTLQNKGLLSRYVKKINMFATALCNLFVPSHPLPVQNTPLKFGRAEFHCEIYPVLAALASYNRHLDQAEQKKLIKCFECGLMTRTSNKVCIVALTAFIFQMSGSMYTLLPEVLLDLSKISATVHIAIPVLEFLSTLISLPQVFASFNQEQFLSVFAITLPYTNPFKFNHYTVSLAHHVIIMWFLKCRLANRKGFVKFIVRGLGANVLQPFEEGKFRKESGSNLSSYNEDSSSRQRSSSLTSEVTSRRVRHMTGLPSKTSISSATQQDRQAQLTFHQELTETCVDLMARYTFSNCGVSPRRSAVTSVLLSQGSSSSWLVGTMIVTLTVSGCAQSANRGGLCDSCAQYCGHETESERSSSKKKRHQSEQSSRSRRTEREAAVPLVKDDSELREREGAGPVGSCGCWCEGWCEVLVRRPSGVTSWICRLQNGVMTNQPGQDSLADIYNILTATINRTDTVLRSNSNPSIGDSCHTITESEESLDTGGLETTSRPRAVTFSSPSKAKPERLSGGSNSGTSGNICPQFMFLQLYQAAGLSAASGEKPILLPNTKTVEASLRILDRIFCYETHKVGVVYVGQGQADDEAAILRNQYGAVRYANFLSGLGTLLDISTIDPAHVFLGGLDPREDGTFHIVWQDDAMQVVYHTATLMPNYDNDPQFNKKKRHIGNDFVAIVYNDSGESYKMGTIKGQFIYAHIIIEPLDFESNRISVVCKPELESELGHLASPRTVSDPNLSRQVRQMALHCNLAANIFSKKTYNHDHKYASNWLERLRHIKRLKSKVLKDLKEEEDSSAIHDFTSYV